MSNTPEHVGLMTELSSERRKLLEKILQEKGKLSAGITPASGTRFPLSFAQERQWILNKFQQDSSFYNVYCGWTLAGFLNQKVLHDALCYLFNRHKGLRMVVEDAEGIPWQHEIESEIPFVNENLNQLPDTQKNSISEKLVQTSIRTPFNLHDEPSVRTLLIGKDQSTHILVVIFHHIASDGWSRSIFSRELSSTYNALLAGEIPDLPELPVQYADYAVWQRNWLQGELLEKQVSYWRQQLSDLPTLELPTSYPRPPVSDYAGEQLCFQIPASQLRALKTLAQQNNCTLFMVLLSVFQILLMRYSSQQDFAVGTPIAGRNRPELENLIGFFVNTLVLRADLSGNPAFTELLGRTREQSLQAFTHQDLPFEKLVEELNPARDLGRNPLFQVMFALQSQPSANLMLQDIHAEPVYLHDKTAKFDLSLSLTETGTELRGNLEYATSLFSAERMQQMLQHWLNLLEAVIAAPETPVGKLPLLSESELKTRLVDWNQTHQDFPTNLTLQTLFEQQVEKSPEAVALISAHEQLTYGQLNRKANQLAHHLQALGVGPDKLVGICLERSAEMVIGLLAILKAGGAYLPLDPDYPTERLRYMLADAAPVALLTQSHLKGTLPKTANTMCLDSDRHIWDVQSEESPVVSVQPGHLAYVIYTSGSTGNPKGVMISHQAIVNLLFWIIDNFRMLPGNKMLVKTSICFDISIMELFAPLICGAHLVLAKPGGEMDSSYLVSLIREHQIDLVFFVPSQLQILLTRSNAGHCASLKVVFCGGEPMTTNLLALFQQYLNANLYNCYGPTEATIIATWFDCSEYKGGDISIGRPMANASCYVLDRFNNPVPQGCKGELHIGGTGLARGYLNNPELTRQKFIDHPFIPGERLYRTGDLASYREDGLLDFHGRLDHQIKLRGYRIETGEIEAELNAHADVTEAHVLLWNKTVTDQYLVAYITGRPEISEQSLRKHLGNRLPEYMLPSFFVMLDSMPLTPNGKLDRKALPPPELHSNADSYAEPRTELECALVAIWQQVLSLEKVGIHDNFFELGGHSLLAMELIHHMKESLGITLPVKYLFEQPTISGLLERNVITLHDKDAVATLEVIQPHGNKTPVFYIGSTNHARKLFPFLEKQQPVYGLNIFGTKEAMNPELPVSIKSIAEQFLQEIKTVSPNGPYQFVAFCGDTPISYEIAQELLRQNEKVSIFFAIDTVWVDEKSSQSKLRGLLKNPGSLTFDLLVKKFFIRVIASMKKSTSAVLSKISGIKSQAPTKSPTVMKHEIFYKKFKVVQGNYLPAGDLDSRVISIMSQDSRQKYGRSGLEKYIRSEAEFTEYTVDSLHSIMFEEPHVCLIAEILNKHLNENNCQNRQV